MAYQSEASFTICWGIRWCQDIKLNTIFWPKRKLSRLNFLSELWYLEMYCWRWSKKKLYFSGRFPGGDREKISMKFAVSQINLGGPICKRLQWNSSSRTIENPCNISTLSNSYFHKPFVLLNLIDKRLMFAAFSRKLVSRINQTDIHGMRSTWHWPRPRRSCLPVFSSTCTSYSHCVVAHCWAILFLKKESLPFATYSTLGSSLHLCLHFARSPLPVWRTKEEIEDITFRTLTCTHNSAMHLWKAITINLTCFTQLCRNRGYMRKSRSISLLITISQKKNPSKCKPRGKKPWYDTINITYYIYSGATWLYISPHVHSRIDFWQEFLAHLMSRLLFIRDVLFFWVTITDCIA